MLCPAGMITPRIPTFLVTRSVSGSETSRSCLSFHVGIVLIFYLRVSLAAAKLRVMLVVVGRGPEGPRCS